MAPMGPVISDPTFGEMTPYEPAELGGFDLLAVVLETLNQQPDKARMASAYNHLLAMVTENRTFLNRVTAETDNLHERLPTL